MLILSSSFCTMEQWKCFFLPLVSALDGMLIERVHSGHAGGENNRIRFHWEKIYVYASRLYCFASPTWLPWTHSIVVIY